MTRPLPLVLLHHAGGGKETFAGWVDRFPGDVRAVAPTLPPRPESVGSAAAMLSATLSGGGPIALFGHSFGAAVAAECAQILTRTGRRDVRWLGLSGWTGPRTKAAPGVASLDDRQIRDELASLEVVGRPAGESTTTVTRRLPTIRAQWAAVEDHRPLIDLGHVPVTWVLGRDDPHTDPRSVLPLSDRSETVELPGGHFFLFEHPTRVIDLIVSSLRRHRPAPTDQENVS